MSVAEDTPRSGRAPPGRTRVAAVSTGVGVPLREMPRWSDMALLRGVIAHSPMALYVVDVAGVVRMWNPGAERLYGWAEAEVVGRRLPIAGPGHRREFDRLRREALRGASTLEFETTRTRKDGSDVEVAISTVPLPDENGSVTAVLGMSRDITRPKAAEAALQRRLRVDELSGLDARAWFLERVEETLAATRRSGGLVYIDIDDFKSINDAFGQAAGDELLRRFADRLRGAVRAADRVGRIGGDQFAVFLLGVGPRGIRAVTDRVFDALKDPIVVSGRSLVVHASAGAVPCNASSKLDDLVRAADLALFEAKRADRGTLRLYDDAMQMQVADRLGIEDRIRGATAAGEMTLHYQPIIDTVTGHLVGVEGLVRWQHPDLGMLPPGRFIPAAEATGEITALGEWVMREACNQAVSWDTKFPNTSRLTMSVNLSTQQLRDPALVAKIGAILDDSGLDPARLQLEVTESVLADASAPLVLRTLRNLGVAIAMDDFGTGYSSLTALRRCPFTALKIDRSFVDGITDNEEDRVIVAAAINLADSLGLRSVAEGVETADQLDFVTRHGCPEAQGYFIGRPAPSADIDDLLSRLDTPTSLAPVLYDGLASPCAASEKLDDYRRTEPL